jgi:hypothetical protein
VKIDDEITILGYPTNLEGRLLNIKGIIKKIDLEKRTIFYIASMVEGFCGSSIFIQ